MSKDIRLKDGIRVPEPLFWTEWRDREYGWPPQGPKCPRCKMLMTGGWYMHLCRDHPHWHGYFDKEKDNE